MSNKQLQQQGFTLLEVLLAVAIFALVSSASFLMLQQMIASKQQFQLKSEQLAELQRTYRLLEQDFSQLTQRSIRDEYGDTQAAILTELMDWGMAVELTVAGRRNPLNKARSNLQRVRYFFDGDNLVRRSWQHLDRAPEAKYLDQILIEGVKTWQLRFLVDGDWQSQIESLTKLQAIEVEVGLDNSRVFTWLFSVSELAQAGIG